MMKEKQKKEWLSFLTKGQVITSKKKVIAF